MSRNKTLKVFSLISLSIPSIGSAGSFFVGYEFGQMAFNEFKHVAGEVGYGFGSKHGLRIAFFDVALSERHLSSDEASAVEGDNVEGIWRGLDLYYDYPITTNVFVSPSVGYHDTKYTHTVLGTSVRHTSPSIGFSVSYLGVDVLGLESLYWRFSLTFGYNLKDQGETKLGESVVKGDPFGIVPAIAIGYEFE